jgi:hypothetical protein
MSTTQAALLRIAQEFQDTFQSVPHPAAWKAPDPAQLELLRANLFPTCRMLEVPSRLASLEASQVCICPP